MISKWYNVGEISERLRIHEKATKNIPTHNAVQRTPRPTLQIRLTPSNQEATKEK
jgi:hypothetical protein